MKKQAFIAATFMIATLANVAAPAFAAQNGYTSQGVVLAGTTKTVVETVNGSGKVTYQNNTFPSGFTAPTTPQTWTVRANNTTFKATFLTESPGQLWVSVSTTVRILNNFGAKSSFNGKTLNVKSHNFKLVNFPAGNPNAFPNVIINSKKAMYGMATKTYQHQVFINLYSAVEPILSDCNVYEVPNMTTKTFVAHLPVVNNYTGFYTSNGQPITN